VDSLSNIMGVGSLLIGAGYQQNRGHAPFRLFNRAAAGVEVQWYLGECLRTSLRRGLC
jgi:hypothetical protein